MSNKKGVKALVLLIFLAIPLYSNAQVWSTLGSSVDDGVYSICDDGHSIYVSKGYSPIRNFIEVWNGTTWDSIGLDCGNQARDLVFFDGKLFSTICENGLEYYDGSSWTSITPGTNPRHIQVIDSVLYAFGGFDSIGTIAAGSIASWDGNLWHRIDTTKWYATITCITSFRNELIIGGNFYNYDGSIQSLARWDGQRWHNLGLNGLNGYINCVITYHDELYIGGRFNIAGIAGNAIARWDGSQWKDVGGGLNTNYAIVEKFIIHNDKLIPLGIFDFAGNIPASNMAAWDGNQWCALNSRFDNKILCAHVFNNQLYIGGGFRSISGDSIRYLAVLDSTKQINDTCMQLIGIEELNIPSFEIYPNPALNQINIRLKEPFHDINSKYEFRIINFTGEIVQTGTLELLENNPAIITLEHLAPGMYYLHLINSSQNFSFKISKQNIRN